MKNVKIFLNKSEIGAGKRGTSLSIDALKIVSIDKDKDFFKDSIFLQHNNDILFEDIENRSPHALYIDEIDKIYSYNHQIIEKEFDKESKMIFVSADHSNTSAYLAGMIKSNPKIRIGVVWIDAHGDLHSPYTTPSGNVHGMTLAMALNEDNLSNKKNDPDDNTIMIWNNIKHLSGRDSMITPQELVFIGLRDLEEEEVKLLNRKGIKYYLGKEVLNSDMNSLADDTIDHLKSCDVIFISFDVDSMDPEKVSYGTGTPVENGLSKNQAKKLIDRFTSNEKVVAFEITEINPLLDEENKMSQTSFEFLQLVKNNFSS